MYKCFKNFSTQISWSTVHSAIITEGKSHPKNRQVFIEDKKSTPRKCQGASAKQNKWVFVIVQFQSSLFGTPAPIHWTFFPFGQSFHAWICMYTYIYMKQTTLKSLGDIESHDLSPLNSSVEALGTPHGPSVATLVGRRLKPTSITSGIPRQKWNSCFARLESRWVLTWTREGPTEKRCDWLEWWSTTVGSEPPRGCRTGSWGPTCAQSPRAGPWSWSWVRCWTSSSWQCHTRRSWTGWASAWGTPPSQLRNGWYRRGNERARRTSVRGPHLRGKKDQMISYLCAADLWICNCT